jgi:hypothetical protein
MKKASRSTPRSAKQPAPRKPAPTPPPSPVSPMGTEKIEPASPAAGAVPTYGMGWGSEEEE